MVFGIAAVLILGALAAYCFIAAFERISSKMNGMWAGDRPVLDKEHWRVAPKETREALVLRLLGSSSFTRFQYVAALLLLATIGLPAVAAVYVLGALMRTFQLQKKAEPDWYASARSLTVTGVLLAAGTLFLVFALLNLNQSFPIGQMIAIILGVTFLGGALAALLNHRAWRKKLISGKHSWAAPLYLPAIPGLAVIGILILSAGL